MTIAAASCAVSLLAWYALPPSTIVGAWVFGILGTAMIAAFIAGSARVLLSKEAGRGTSLIPRLSVELDQGRNLFRDPLAMRSQGPVWVDFESGFVAPPRETNIVLERLNSEPVVVIRGTPASGKSVVLRSVGFALLKSGRPNAPVHYIRLKGGLSTSKSDLLSQARNLVEGSVLLVDDGHLDPGFIEDLLSQGPRYRLVVSTREIQFGAFGGTWPKFQDHYGRGLLVEPQGIVDDLVRIHEEKVLHGPLSVEVRSKVSGLSKNLWYVSLALASSSRNRNSSSRFDVEGAMGEYIGNWMTQTLPHMGVNVADEILYVLSLSSQYEIQMQSAFVLSFLRDSGEVSHSLKRLVDLGEIRRVRNYVSLHHAELARNYLHTYERHPDLAVRARRMLGAAPEVRLFEMYVEYCPEESLRVLRSLIRERHGPLEASSQAVVKSLLSSRTLPPSVFAALDGLGDEVEFAHALVLLALEVGYSEGDVRKLYGDAILERIMSLDGCGKAKARRLGALGLSVMSNCIGQANREDVIGYLLRRMAESDVDTVVEGADALKVLAHLIPVRLRPSVFNTLADLATGPSVQNKKWAIDALSHIVRPWPVEYRSRAIDLFLKETFSMELGVVKWASDGLGTIGDQTPIAARDIVCGRLLELLQIDDEGVVAWTCDSLENFGQIIPLHLRGKVVPFASSNI